MVYFLFFLGKIWEGCLPISLQMHSWNTDTHWKTVKTSNEKNTTTHFFKTCYKRVFKTLCCRPKSKCWALLCIINKTNSKSPDCCSFNVNTFIKSSFRTCSYKVKWSVIDVITFWAWPMYFVVGHAFHSTMMLNPQIRLRIIAWDHIEFKIDCSTLLLYRLQTSTFFHNSFSSMRRFCSRFSQRYF